MDHNDHIETSRERSKNASSLRNLSLGQLRKEAQELGIRGAHSRPKYSAKKRSNLIDDINAARELRTNYGKLDTIPEIPKSVPDVYSNNNNGTVEGYSMPEICRSVKEHIPKAKHMVSDKGISEGSGMRWSSAIPIIITTCSLATFIVVGVITNGNGKLPPPPPPGVSRKVTMLPSDF